MPPAGVFSGSLKGRLALAACTFRPQRVFGMRVFGMHVVVIVVMMMVMAMFVIVAVTMFVMMVVFVIMAVAVIMPVVVMPHIETTLPGAEQITEFTIRHV